MYTYKMEEGTETLKSAQYANWNDAIAALRADADSLFIKGTQRKVWLSIWDSERHDFDRYIFIELA